MIRVLMLIALFLFALAPAQAQGRTAQQVVDGFQAAGFPVAGVVAYDERSDPNRLLGRPGQYIEKVSWWDTRLRAPSEPEAPGVLDGGSIERFANLNDLRERQRYLEAVASGGLFGEYRFVNEPELMILRITFGLVPSDANDYGAAFMAG